MAFTSTSNPVTEGDAAAVSSTGSQPEGCARFLVGISGSPFGPLLLEATRALAAAAGATWIAVHVETPFLLPPDEQRQRDADLTRARELGAKIIVTLDLEIADALLRVAREQGVTHLVVGQSPPQRFARWRRPSLAEQLVRGGRHLTLHVIPADPTRIQRRPWRLLSEPASPWWEYGLVMAAITGVTIVGLLLPPVSHVSIGLIYLLAVIVASLWLGRWPVLLGGVLSALVWEYVFIPPRFAIAIATGEDALLFGTYFVVALVAGQLTARIRTQAQNERLREERATALLQLTRSLAEASSFDAAALAALRQVDALFDAATVLGLRDDPGGTLRFHSSGSFAPNETETAAGLAAFRSAEPAGRWTRNVPEADGYYLPLRVERGAIGVLGVKLARDATLSLAQRDLIEAFAHQLALVAEREHLRAASEREKLLAASDKLHRSLFDSVSHELRTPLAVIDAAMDGLADADERARTEMVAEIRIAVRRLNRLVRNLLDQTRLESGALKPRLDWCHVRDLVNVALDGTRDALGDRPVEITIPDDMPPIRADFALTEHALMNLVLNAALHTPAGSAVAIGGGFDATREHVCLSVADRGPGFPASVRDRLFKKFARGDSARAGGLGLGLSIVRGLITAQGGDVTIGERPGGGAVVTILLPHTASDEGFDHE